jgi:large subunit ribosomal protein L5
MARKEKSANATGNSTIPKSRMRKVYVEKAVPKLQETFNYESAMQLPRLVKIVVNMGTGHEEKEVDNAIRDIRTITGQQPVATRARISVSNFKIREGMKVGCRVTLRGDRMLHFFDKLCTVALPRIRDFQGLPANSFDGRGNYTFGLKEQLVFPEIDYDSFDKPRGMDITICTTARTDAEGRELLKAMGMPIREK